MMSTIAKYWLEVQRMARGPREFIAGLYVGFTACALRRL